MQVMNLKKIIIRKVFLKAMPRVLIFVMVSTRLPVRNFSSPGSQRSLKLELILWHDITVLKTVRLSYVV